MPTPSRALIEVAIPVPLRRLFNYSVPGLAPPRGSAVTVPFKGRTLTGWVVGEGREVEGLLDIHAVLDPATRVTGELLELARWIADYYLAPPGLVLRAMVPAPRASRPKQRLVARVLREIGTLGEIEEIFGRATRQREAFERIVAGGGVRALAALKEDGFSRAVVDGLARKGLVGVEKAVVLRDPFGNEPPGQGPAHVPTAAQRSVIARLAAALESGGGTFLLHGVTSSGKTLVYIELIRRALKRGTGAIVLVPEIALTPQTVARFRSAFGDLVAVLHSALSQGERFDAWREVRAGRKRIVIGARSAVFAPLPRLGALVVDEEHDGSYKQSTTPRYQGRDVAVVRARRAGAVCLLGSATPSLESWANARSGKYTLLELPDRVGGGVLPSVHVVDLRKDARTSPAPATSSSAHPSSAPSPPPDDRRVAGSPPSPPGHILSPLLAELLRRRVADGEQTILLLNRRGYASFALCQGCGEVLECPNCSVSLTLHRARHRMICHHCGYGEPPPDRCRSCGDPTLSWRGLGTEQVERIVHQCLPGARIARMDVDTTRGRWSHRDILERVRSGEVDILLGTQMIAKGLDFPRVTLVGVINADIGLHFPDFRSSERTFQLISQVAGRAGRGRLPGEVVIQSYLPDHYVIRSAVTHDYAGFVERELASRADPPYPPFARMARIVLSSPGQGATVTAAEMLGEWLRPHTIDGPEALGPAPAPFERLQRRYRWHLILRGRPADLSRALLAVANEFRPPGNVHLAIDRDPSDLM